MPDTAPPLASTMTAEEYEAERAREEAARGKNGTGGVLAFPVPVSGRLLPHNDDAERMLLASCLIEEDEGLVLKRARDSGISSLSFYTQAHSTAFGCLVAMQEEKKPINGTILAQELKTRRLLPEDEIYPFVVSITGLVPTTAQAGYFIHKVREQALLREFIRAQTAGVEDAYNFSGDIDEFIAMQEARLKPLLRSRGVAAKGLTVWQPAQFRAWQPPLELNLLGAGYLRRRQITTLIGPPGVGKSRLSFWMGVCHIAGRSCAGLDPKGGKLRWLFIGNENDPERQKRDLDFFYRNLTAEEQREVDDRLFLHVMEKFEDAQLTLIDPDAFARVSATLKAVKPDVVVFDPWGNMIEGSESDDENIRSTLKRLMRATGENAPETAILIIHHARTGKVNTIEAGNNYSGGSLGRGSKVLVSQARCELALWPGDAEDASKLVLTCEKVNNAPKFEPVGLLFENGIYTVDGSFSVKEWRDDIEGKRSTKTLTVADVVNCVRDGVVRYRDICTRLEYASETTVTHRLGEAVRKGYLKKTEPRGSYEIVPEAFRKARDITESSVEPVVIEEPPPDLFHK